MDEFNSIIPSISCPNPTGFANHSPVDFDDNQMALIELAHETEVTRFEMSDNIKAQIANHPLYPNLVSAYIECRKVGVPPEMASLLEEVSKETHSTVSNGADPELDEFMTSYCEVLHRCKEKLSKPFDEAKSFLSNIEFQLSNLCKDTFASTTSSSLTSLNYHSADDGNATSDEDVGCEVEATENQESLGTRQGDHELKEILMRKYSGYLSSLRKDFLRKRRKGKLPKDARTVLVDWWNTHFKWPYPTEEEKNKLSELTGLDQKQINNWFINQRKRHWRPSEDLRFAFMEGPSNGTSEPMYFDAAGGTGGIDT